MHDPHAWFSSLLADLHAHLSQVLKLMQSFKSQEFVTERYSWRYYYWFLTDKVGRGGKRRVCVE